VQDPAFVEQFSEPVRQRVANVNPRRDDRRRRPYILDDDVESRRGRGRPEQADEHESHRRALR
jgi:hypothetical protein